MHVPRHHSYDKRITEMGELVNFFFKFDLRNGMKVRDHAPCYNSQFPFGGVLYLLFPYMPLPDLSDA